MALVSVFFGAKHVQLPVGRHVLLAAPLTLTDWLANRIEGLPTKKIEKTVHRSATFVFTTKDGVETPALPERVGSGATAAARAEDELILAPVRV